MTSTASVNTELTTIPLPPPSISHLPPLPTSSTIINTTSATATKPRLSPLDFRNTDLVTRLLAATPPYLYNIPMVPNSFFFSEMLRSLVQAKTHHDQQREQQQSSTQQHHRIHLSHLQNQFQHNQQLLQLQQQQIRRSRKRAWTQPVRNEYYQQKEDHSSKYDKSESTLPTTTNWNPIKSILPEKTTYYDTDQKRSSDFPLELTTEKISTNNNNTIGNCDFHKLAQTATSDTTTNETKPSQFFPQQDATNLSLYHQQSVGSSPQPPPMWYHHTPMYPSPYAIDPLHFFIDLRVSGHIYDRKNSTKSPSEQETSPDGRVKPENVNEQQSSITHKSDGFKASGPRSAFSVPTSRKHQTPMNLSNSNKTNDQPLKFDVKSLGFDKTTNKTSLHYIMRNIQTLYKDINNYASNTSESSDLNYKIDVNNSEETLTCYSRIEHLKESQKVNDLKRLLSFNMIADYMNKQNSGLLEEFNKIESSSEESALSSSPNVEVVALADEQSEDT